jgi:hypothetical protein
MTVRQFTGAARLAAAIAVVLFMTALATGVLFPEKAHAVVNRKHARVYRAYVATLATTLAQDQQAYNGFSEDLAEIALDIEALLNDPPVDQDALRSLEGEAQTLVGNIESARMLPRQLRAMAEKVYKDALPWFRTGADKRTLRRGTNKISTGADLILLAYKHLGEAATQLATDPPDLGKAREYNQQCVDAVNLANPRFKKGMLLLRSLRR